MKVAEITGGIYLGIDIGALYRVDRLGIRLMRLDREEINLLVDNIIFSIFESLI